MTSLLKKWLFMGVACVAALIWFFFAQLWSIASDWMGSRDGGVHALSAQELAGIRAIRYLPIDHQVTTLTVSDLRVLGHSGQAATVELQLTSSQPTSLYPAIRVYLQAGGRTVRTVLYRPTEYAHRDRLESEPVRLTIPLQAGETGFTATAYFDFSGV
ncbi:hypothetical protein [Burkholderia cenocepacia]|uniref:hypothetical protein n=1 Tax=Burkholderia cepacia complex TaxID=87882 RepID=UPI00196AEC0B|nr:hypothetical protein [Burkholderia cenocepacia]MBN3506354.1 hypothetical protein [Burkholderia cenocepacia]MBR8029874.1 hypothetical protein [Burkholderia cenocepacia]MBR8173425.1 hypothetical protein [Burkholderia cenocepacia]